MSQYIGIIGAWQWRIICITGIFCIPISTHIMIMTFMNAPVGCPNCHDRVNWNRFENHNCFCRLNSDVSHKKDQKIFQIMERVVSMLHKRQSVFHIPLKLEQSWNWYLVTLGSLIDQCLIQLSPVILTWCVIGKLDASNKSYLLKFWSVNHCKKIKGLNFNQVFASSYDQGILDIPGSDSVLLWNCHWSVLFWSLVRHVWT